MPKIRDLGISHIPLTMRPPEIGPGGAYDMPAPDAAFPMYLTETCPGNSCETNSGGQCVPSGCADSCGESCPGDTCGDTCQGDSRRDADRKTSALGDQAILALKQQLHDRIGTQLQM